MFLKQLDVQCLTKVEDFCGAVVFLADAVAMVFAAPVLDDVFDNIDFSGAENVGRKT